MGDGAYQSAWLCEAATQAAGRRAGLLGDVFFQADRLAGGGGGEGLRSTEEFDVDDRTANYMADNIADVPVSTRGRQRVMFRADKRDAPDELLFGLGQYIQNLHPRSMDNDPTQVDGHLIRACRLRFRTTSCTPRRNKRS